MTSVAEMIVARQKLAAREEAMNRPEVDIFMGRTIVDDLMHKIQELQLEIQALRNRVGELEGQLLCYPIGTIVGEPYYTITWTGDGFETEAIGGEPLP